MYELVHMSSISKYSERKVKVESKCVPSCPHSDLLLQFFQDFSPEKKKKINI